MRKLQTRFGMGILLFVVMCFGWASAGELRLPAGTERICAEAFRGDTGLDQVVLPESLRVIESRAFAESSLKGISLPDLLEEIADDAFEKSVAVTARVGPYAYWWGVRNGYINEKTAPAEDFQYRVLSDQQGVVIEKYKGDRVYVIVPETLEGLPVTCIGYAAFARTGVAGVVLPETVRVIRAQAFEGCESLAGIIMPPEMETVGDWAFSGCISLISLVIPEGVKTVPSNLCSGCDSLRRVRLPQTAEAIGGLAFRNCLALTGVTIPGNVKTIGEYAFSGCTSLLSLAIPEGVKTIPQSLCSVCDNLRFVSLPSTAEEIGAWAFSDCRALTGVAIAGNVKTIGEHAFYGCTRLETLALPASLQVIGEYAFANCSRLTAIDIPDPVKVISENAFSRCEMLSSVRLPAGLEIMEKNAFFRCISLLELSFPGSLKEIRSQALPDFSGILRFSGPAPQLAEDIFGQESKLIAVYPHDQAGWGQVIGRTLGASFLYWKADNADSTVPADVKPASEPLAAPNTSNGRKNDYQTVWCRGTIASYLAEEQQGQETVYTRVDYADGLVHIEQYTAAMQMIWKKTIVPELPKWGGFYAGDNANYLFFGQDNPAMDDNTEVIRIVRYTKNWTRIGELSIRAANTKEPFAFGTVRAMQSGDILYVHTCRVMYSGHQSSMDIKIFIPTMTKLALSTVYTSHSFNQFVIDDGQNIAWLNHGDAYPRSIQLTVERGSAGMPGNGPKTNLDLMTIGGTRSDPLYQNTRASVGGFECSGTHYLAAGKSIDQRLYGQSERQNIYVIAADRNNLTQSGIQTTWFTFYPENDPRYVSTPHLVKISSDRFLLMWVEQMQAAGAKSELHYVFLDNRGKAVSGIYVQEGNLSDCQPIVSRNAVIWYVAEGATTAFYLIDLSAPSQMYVLRF